MRRHWMLLMIVPLFAVPMVLAHYPRHLAAKPIGGLDRTQAAGITPMRAIGSLDILYSKDGKLYAMEDHFLYVSADTGRTFAQVGRLPKPDSSSLATRIRDIVARSPMVRRFRKNSGPRNMVVLNSGTVLIFYDQIYRSVEGGRKLSIVPNTNSRILPEPFPFPLGVAVGPGDTVYYGDYTTRSRPHTVRIVRGLDDGRRWDVVHTFGSGELFHIHSITYDKYRHRFWIAAGDTGQEARLMYTADGFRTIQTEGCCSQKWRIVQLIVTDTALYWGSDGEDASSELGIYRYDPEQGELQQLATLRNPSYHAARLSDGTMVISTTYEPGTPYTLRAQPPATTALWLSRHGKTWTRALSLSADSAALRKGRRPQISMPAGDPIPTLLVTPWFTREWGFTTLSFRRHDSAGPGPSAALPPCPATC